MNVLKALQLHWPEYLIEAGGLGLFMVSAGMFGTLLEYPESPIHQWIASPFIRRMLMGLAMGLTAVGLIYSPWGKQSGAHFNPAVTLTFLRLGKVARWDAFFYVVAQFAGGLCGVLLVRALLGLPFTAAPVSYVMTLPGLYGPAAAAVGEAAITALLMGVILFASNTPRLARYTGLLAGALVALYITLEAPISGMSMNPARSFASAAPAGMWEHLWIYLVAPPVGMLAAAQVYRRVFGTNHVHCAKLHHQNSKRCIFCLSHKQVTPVRAAAPERSTAGFKVIAGVIH